MHTEHNEIRSAPSGEFAAIARGFVGILIGAVVGSIAFYIFIQRGAELLILPGALVGICCSGLMGRRIAWMGIVCGLVALVVTLGLEWKFLPFVKDKSLAFFIKNVWFLPPFKLALLLAGPALAGWFGSGRDGAGWFGLGRG